MINVSSVFNWFGDKVTAGVLGLVDRELEQKGQRWLAITRATVHVQTGEMRAGLFYKVENHTLIVGDTSPHAIFEELGTRYRPGHPAMREALLEIGTIFGGDLELQFAAPTAGTWQGMYYHKGSYITPSGIQPRPLTQAQHRHVQQHLVPVSKALHRGNVRRARMRVRKFD